MLGILMEKLVGLTKQSHPNLTGSASNFLSVPFGGPLPHKEGIKVKWMQSSRGCRRSCIFGVVLHRKLNLCTSPMGKGSIGSMWFCFSNLTEHL